MKEISTLFLQRSDCNKYFEIKVEQELCATKVEEVVCAAKVEVLMEMLAKDQVEKFCAVKDELEERRIAEVAVEESDNG